MCPSPHDMGPNPQNMVKHSTLSIVPTEYIEKIHQSPMLIFLRPRSVTGVLGSECKYRVLGPDYSINPPEYKSFKAALWTIWFIPLIRQNELPTAPVTFSSLEMSTNVCKITILAHCEVCCWTDDDESLVSLL